MRTPTMAMAEPVIPIGVMGVPKAMAVATCGGGGWKGILKSQCPGAFNIYVNTESTFENANQNDNPLHGIADGLSHRGHEAEDLESKLVVGVEIPARHEEGGRELELKKKKRGKFLERSAP